MFLMRHQIYKNVWIDSLLILIDIFYHGINYVYHFR